MKNVCGYSITPKEIFQIHSIMRCKRSCKAWILFVFNKSVSLLECYFDDTIWTNMWREIRKFYDCRNPQMPPKISDLQITSVNCLKNTTRKMYFFLERFPELNSTSQYFRRLQNSLHTVSQVRKKGLKET